MQRLRIRPFAEVRVGIPFCFKWFFASLLSACWLKTFLAVADPYRSEIRCTLSFYLVRVSLCYFQKSAKIGLISFLRIVCAEQNSASVFLFTGDFKLVLWWRNGRLNRSRSFSVDWFDDSWSCGFGAHASTAEPPPSWVQQTRQIN